MALVAAPRLSSRSIANNQLPGYDCKEEAKGTRQSPWSLPPLSLGWLASPGSRLPYPLPSSSSSSSITSHQHNYQPLFIRFKYSFPPYSLFVLCWFTAGYESSIRFSPFRVAVVTVQVISFIYLVLISPSGSISISSAGSNLFSSLRMYFFHLVQTSYHHLFSFIFFHLVLISLHGVLISFLNLVLFSFLVLFQFIFSIWL